MKTRTAVLLLVLASTANAEPDPCAVQRIHLETAKPADRYGYEMDLQACEAAQTRKKTKILTPNIPEERAAPTEEDLNNAMRDDKKQMAAIFGAEICLLQIHRSSALEQIAKEKKYSKLGGVENRVVLYKLQKTVMLADDRIAKSRREMAKFKGVKALPCSSIEVKRVAACKVSDDCINARYERMSRFVQDIEEEEDED